MHETLFGEKIGYLKILEKLVYKFNANKKGAMNINS